MKKIIRANCGHFEFTGRIIKQLGQTNCRDCANKVNKKLTKIMKGVLKNGINKKVEKGIAE